jgi:type I restriction enzyme M protein
LDDQDKIELDDKSIVYIVGELQIYSLLDCSRDVVGDAFEVFIHRALKGGQGQFFTPRNVVQTAINILDPNPDEKIIDPACGSGGFLVEALRHVHNKIDIKGKNLGWPSDEISSEKISKVNTNFRGIEKDDFLGKLAKAYMVLLGDGKSGVFPGEDSLNKPSDWNLKTRNGIQLESFDIVVTNPPFGAKIKVNGSEKLSQFQLGYKWEFDETNNKWIKTSKLKEDESPQVLFIERCMQLLKEGGRMAIVLPDGILSNPSDRYIVEYLLSCSEILGLIDMPMSTFLPKTPTKTHLLFVKKTSRPKLNYDFFMSYAYTCGHDKRGRENSKDEISLIPEFIKKIKSNKLSNKKDHLGFFMQSKDIKDYVLLPKFYNPELDIELSKYEDSGKFTVKSIGDLIEEGIVELKRGNEVGSENYGSGSIPFVRTSEVANWEIAADSTHCLSEEIYYEYKEKQDVQNEDILVVNDGTYLMGRAAMITENDLKIVYQSHFRKMRVLKKDKFSPYALLGLLGLEVVQRQIEAKCFRQGTISTLGNRLKEIKIPIPKDKNIMENMHKEIKKIINDKKIGKKISQSYNILNKQENLMGIINKAKLGNL